MYRKNRRRMVLLILLISLILGVLLYASSQGHKKSSTAKKNIKDLANFRISVPEAPSHPWKTRNRKPGRWVKPGEVITIKKIKISRGFFYWGGRLENLNDGGTESSLVDPSLTISSPPDHWGRKMSFWPGYHLISPESRGAYIHWLAGSRDDPKACIPYVFLYFYGIERRLLVDDSQGQLPQDERNALIQELYRLRRIYGGSPSFHGSVTYLLSHLWVMYRQNEKGTPSSDLLLARKKFTSAFKYLLGDRVAKGEPVSSRLALIWLKSHPEFTLKTPARRCEKEFDLLFRIRFEQQFGPGLKILPNKTRLRIHYFPRNSSLRGYQSTPLDLPDVTRLKAPVKKFMTIAESCTRELQAFSRFLGRKENAADSLEAAALLPPDLIREISPPSFESLRSWLAEQISPSPRLISVEEILGRLGPNRSLKSDSSRVAMLANMVEKAGFGMAPDSRFHHAKPEIRGKVVLFPGGHGWDFSPSPGFRQAEIILRLGVQTAPGENRETESPFFQNWIIRHQELTEREKKSLRAYLHWLWHTPSPRAGLKAPLTPFSEQEKEALGRLITRGILADAGVTPGKIKQLEKLYTSLGLKKSLVTTNIHRLSSSQAGEEKGPPVPAKAPPPDEFALDRDLLAAVKEDTGKVQTLLESIFEEEQAPEEQKEKTSAQAPPRDTALPPLDKKHHRLYEKLITQKEWPFAEVEQLCRELNLMVNGAIEVINEWAQDSVEAPLIDEGSTVFIDLEIAEEIAAM